MSVVSPEASLDRLIDIMVFEDNSYTRTHLRSCNFLKQKFSDSNDMDYLNLYYKVRKDINFKLKHNVLA